MKVYEPPPGAPDTAMLDNWPPPGELCVTEQGYYCVHFDEHNWITDKENWCIKHDAQCQLIEPGRPAKCVRCRVDLPKPGQAGPLGYNCEKEQA